MSTDLKEINISKEVYSWFENLEAVCQKNKFYVDDQTTVLQHNKYSDRKEPGGYRPFSNA